MGVSIAIASAAFPPDLDGIGDYTFALAKALSADPRIKLPVCVATSRGNQRSSYAGVNVCECFDVADPMSFAGIKRRIDDAQPDWFVLQYNPFGFGKRGFCPHLVSSIRKLVREKETRPRLAVMFHEVATDERAIGARIMWMWQMVFARWLAALADRIFVACEAYGRKLGKRHGQRSVLLPVGSNIPLSSLARDEAKRRLGAERELVLGSFGTCHPSRRFDWIAEAVSAVHRAGIPTRYIHVGAVPPADQFQGVRTLFAGELPPEEVANAIQSMDLFLSPFKDGISARRGSAIAALQHGLPVVTTHGKNTDDLFTRHEQPPVFLSVAKSGSEFARDVLSLVHSPDTRGALSVRGSNLFESTFAWHEIANKLITHLQE